MLLSHLLISTQRQWPVIKYSITNFVWVLAGVILTAFFLRLLSVTSPNLMLFSANASLGHFSSSSSAKQLPVCPAKPAGLLGAVKVVEPSYLHRPRKGRTSPAEQVFTDQHWQTLFHRLNSNMLDGGHYRPPDCRARQRLAIVIPYRNREEHLYTFLHHMLPILKRQLLEFKIYVIEQGGEKEERFNRGLMMNIGLVEALRDEEEMERWTCVIFHDVDLVLENDKNMYVCDDEPQRRPRHMSVAVSSLNYTLPYNTLLGGVTAFPVQTFREINGFSNLYWGWGVEDDDLAERVELRNGIARGNVSNVSEYIIRPEAAIGRYKALRHKKRRRKDVSPERSEIRKFIKQNMFLDGLTSLKYRVKQMGQFQIFTWIKVDVHKADYKGKLQGFLR